MSAKPKSQHGGKRAAPRAILTHAQPGRARIRLPHHRDEPGLLAKIGEELGRHPEVVRVVANAITGSLLIEHQGTLEEILKDAEELSLFALSHSGHTGMSGPPSSPLSHFQRVTSPTSSVKFDTVIGVVLLGLAALQARRGKFLPAGLTLVFNGLDYLQSHV